MPAANTKVQVMAVALISLLGNANPKLGAEAHKRFCDRRRMANVLRRFNRGLLVSDDQLKSIAKCGNPVGSTIMFRQGTDGHVRPGGIATCKSVWGCLGCAARKRALKSAMVKHYVDAHLDAGKGVSFASFTFAHYAEDTLHDLLEGLRKAFTDMRHLKVYKDAEKKYGVIGWIAALEITDGINGWHPHLHVLFFHDQYLDVEYGGNHGLRLALYEGFSRQIDRHLGRQVHQMFGVDLVPVRTEARADGDDAIAKYLGKIQLEMTRQDLKDGKAKGSRSPWLIGLDAAETGCTQDAARWCEYLRATKGRNVVTRSKSLAAHYGDPTPKQLDDLLTDDVQTDDQAEETDDGENIASMDADVWTDLSRHRTDPAASLTAQAITVLETSGPEEMSEVITERLGKAVQVVTHHESGLPHLQYADPAHRRRYVGDPKQRPDKQPAIDLEELGPVARAWYGAANPQPKETP